MTTGPFKTIEMEEKPVYVIRETTRNLLKWNRRQNRDEETDIRRSLGKLTIMSSDYVQEIANKLKTKSSISAIELRNLKNALVEDTKNIELVLNTHGTLRGLVRELSGVDVNKQCEAAGCICNLSLGDSRSGAIVAKASGSYLIANLDNMSSQLSVTCAWVVGNLSSSGSKACDVLVAGGAVPKLCELLASTDEHLRDAAEYALIHLTHQMKDDLREDYVTRILGILSNINSTETSLRLLFVISCHKSFMSPHNLTDILLLKILQDLKNCVEKNPLTTENANQCTYLVRTLANMYDSGVYSVVINYFTTNHITGCLKKVLCSSNVVAKESLLWFLGNMYNFYSENEFFCDLFK